MSDPRLGALFLLTPLALLTQCHAPAPLLRMAFGLPTKTRAVR
jgi:hypothetical protein